MKNQHMLKWAACLLVALAAGCASERETELAPVEMTFSSTQEMAATSTATPEVPATAIVTPTITPTFVPVPVSDVPLDPEGPWFLFLAWSDEARTSPRHLLAVNADGSGLKQLVDDDVLVFKVRPGGAVSGGALVAYVTPVVDQEDNFALKLLALPEGTVTTVATLNDSGSVLERSGYPAMRYALAPNGLVWSPDGEKLAFVGALDGGSADVYVYDVATDSIIRLSETPSNAFNLSWSPDSQFVLHSDFDFVGQDGPVNTSLWAVRADGQGMVILYEPTMGADGFPIEYYEEAGWTNSGKVWLVVTATGKSALRVVEPATGQSHDIFMSEEYVNYAFAPERNLWLAITGDGLSLISESSNREIGEGHYSSVSWWEDEGFWVARTKSSLTTFAVSTSGEMQPLLENEGPAYSYSIIPSPDGKYWAWHYYAPLDSSLFGLRIGERQATPEIVYESQGTNASEFFAASLTWSPDSQRILLLSKNGLWVTEAPDFELERRVDGLYGSNFDNWQGVWIP